MNNPQQLRYSKEHEWLSDAEDGVSTVGITELRGQRARRCRLCTAP